jgi:hypothetical protein
MPAPKTAAVQTVTPTLSGRSLLFSVGMIAATGVVALALALSATQPFSRRYQTSRYWSQFNLWWLRMTCQIDYQISGAGFQPLNCPEGKED